MHGRKNQKSVSSPGESPELPAFLKPHADGVTLAIRLQPRASRNEIGDPTGPELRIKVTAPPVDAAANEALIRLLAETLDCSRRDVVLVHGHTARSKVIKIFSLSATDALTRLRAAHR
mgnify:CR=1 FL=1